MAELRKADFLTTNELISLTRDDYAFEEAAALIQLRAEKFIIDSDLLEYEEDQENVTAEILNNYSTYESEFKLGEPKLMSVIELIVALSNYREAKFKSDNLSLENSVYLVIRKALGACEYTSSERGSLNNKANKKELVFKAAKEKLKSRPNAKISEVAEWIRKDIINNPKLFGFEKNDKVPSVKTLQNSWIERIKS